MTYALLVANTAVFALLEIPYWLRGGQGAGPFGFIPAEPSMRSLVASMFSHAGLLHLAGNMLMLWLFGSITEDVLGPLLFLGFYFGGQLGATILDVSIAKSFAPASMAVPRIGASGAIAGILGLSAVCVPRVRVRVWYFLILLLFIWRWGTVRVPAWFFLGAWLALQLVGGVAATWSEANTGMPGGGTAYWAHIGGFGVGVVFAYILALPAKIRRHDLLSGVTAADDDGSQRYAQLHDTIRESPEDAEAWLALARSSEAHGFTPRAAEAYARATTLFLQQRDPENAARAYKAAVHYDPGFILPAPAQFDIGVALTHAGEYRDALTAFDGLLRAYPDSPEGEVARVRAGDLAEKTGDRETALKHFEEVVKRYPLGGWRDYAQQKIRELRQPAES